MMISPTRRAFGTGLFAALMSGIFATEGRAKPRYDRDRIKAMVVGEAIRMNVSLSLALAVAHVESDFNPRALSPKGARGVMQIMPDTAWQEYGIAPDELWRPRINIRIGLNFLDRLIDQYRGRTDIALSHYNGGSRVRRGGRLRIIPATRRYVGKVQRYQRIYHQKILRGHV